VRFIQRRYGNREIDTLRILAIDDRMGLYGLDQHGIPLVQGSLEFSTSVDFNRALNHVEDLIGVFAHFVIAAAPFVRLDRVLLAF
jgi:hypothetical protein